MSLQCKPFRSDMVDVDQRIKVELGLCNSWLVLFGGNDQLYQDRLPRALNKRTLHSIHSSLPTERTPILQNCRLRYMEFRKLTVTLRHALLILHLINSPRTVFVHRVINC